MQELRNVQISKIPFIPRVLGKIILHQGHLKICSDDQENLKTRSTYYCQN